MIEDEGSMYMQNTTLKYMMESTEILKGGDLGNLFCGRLPAPLLPPSLLLSTTVSSASLSQSLSSDSVQYLPSTCSSKDLLPISVPSASRSAIEAGEKYYFPANHKPDKIIYHNHGAPLGTITKTRSMHKSELSDENSICKKQEQSARIEA